ncbi:MAG: SAM-dependent methyltransferase, partial [Acidobacteria bacterium]|nr:SAM-dependent methyltransferase [Acidobacteriota bacterium]
CLYHPELGYYNTERTKLGASGDFYTSAHVAPVFARVLARHFERLWKKLDCPSRFDLVELGPGDGLFASELLTWVEQYFPDFFSCLRYVAIEQGAHLRNRLQMSLSHFGSRITILPSLPIPPNTDGFQGCVFASEFFDALPVHILIWRVGRWRERRVGLEGEKLVWVERELVEPGLAEQAELRFHAALPQADRQDGWVSEISPLATAWMARIGQCLARGQTLIVDYGYTLEEWRRGRFPEGSALAYRSHQVCYDLLAHAGDQDLTAHVNFTQLIEAGERAGLQLASFQSQAQFLMELGQENEFADLFSDCRSDLERLRRSQLLKTLILPQGMGEAFRVLRMEKSLAKPAP